MSLPLLGHLAGGELVYDRANSHLHEQVAEILPEALNKINAEGRQFLVAEAAFGRIIGHTACLPTGQEDEILYAQRPKRFGLSRFVKNRTPEPSEAVTVILKKDDNEDYYILITAFIGTPAPPEPWDRNATPQSVPFWSTHALVWGQEPIVPGTETSRCPWA